MLLLQSTVNFWQPQLFTVHFMEFSFTVRQTLFESSWLGPVSPPTPSLSVRNVEIQHLTAHQLPFATSDHPCPRANFTAGDHNDQMSPIHHLISSVGADEVRHGGRKVCGIMIIFVVFRSYCLPDTTHFDLSLSHCKGTNYTGL